MSSKSTADSGFFANNLFVHPRIGMCCATRNLSLYCTKSSISTLTLDSSVRSYLHF